MISITWVVFTYSIATPLLYPISMCIFFVFYWKDKYFLLKNYYKKPQQYEGGLVNLVDSLLQNILILHFIGGFL